MLWETECFIEAILGSSNHIWEYLHEVSTLACPVFLTETPTCSIRLRSMDITQINLNFTLAINTDFKVRNSRSDQQMDLI